MTAENFCYWLKGYFEILRVENPVTDKLTSSQVKTIEQHLELVFTKVTPEVTKENLPTFEEVIKILKDNEDKKTPRYTDLQTLKECSTEKSYC